MNKAIQIIQLIKNMGPGYLGFRIWFELKKKTGLLKLQFPSQPPFQKFIHLNAWKSLDRKFFFECKEALSIPKNRDEQLKASAEAMLKGDFEFFSSTRFHLGGNYDWVTNPDTGFKYDSHQHWTAISDYSKEAGDIKYVWEKSRFTFIDTLIRYDYHFDTDLSAFVFSEIEDWIDKNPINCGPNYKCSQEITLRSLNWLFALHYYKNSSSLTPDRFDRMMHVLYWQAKHVFENIQFSKIAVRNNHAITECLGIYLFGLLFPFFPESGQWRKLGKKWFEEEVAYQVYEDGTFLQFSMNYHRVVVQLLSWAIRLNQLNDTAFEETVYIRAKSSLKFLLACMNTKNGMLPNYGANDGALFFKLNNQQFRDYRPQLEALARCLDEKWSGGSFEDKCWYGFKKYIGLPFVGKDNRQLEHAEKFNFDIGGYYILRDDNTLTFIRCGNHKDRPSQADNLHIDIWVDDENILRDGGSYKYNTSEEEIRYFFGTASHNTVMLNSYDQMQKGARFIWYYWSQSNGAEIKEEDHSFHFSGEINAFSYLKKDIRHRRTVIKTKGKSCWEVCDEVINNPGLFVNQIWHPHSLFFEKFTIHSKDEKGEILLPKYEKGFYSGMYGKKDESLQLIFTGKGSKIITTIKKKETNQSG